MREARGEEARSLQLEIAHLKEQRASRTKALFGDSSEPRPNAEQTTDEPKETLDWRQGSAHPRHTPSD